MSEKRDVEILNPASSKELFKFQVTHCLIQAVYNEA